MTHKHIVQVHPVENGESETCANCKHNEWPFGNCDGCIKQIDETQTGNWEPKGE